MSRKKPAKASVLPPPPPAPRKMEEINQQYSQACLNLGDAFHKRELYSNKIPHILQELARLEDEGKAAQEYWAKNPPATPAQPVKEGAK